ncbi:MAG: AAA family ATPase [Candidatus Saccharimonas sp.]
MTEPNCKVIAFVGLAGSGKSESVEYITKKGVPKVYFGGVVLDAMTEAGLEHTQENEKPFREELRAREGNDFVAKRIITQINDLIGAGQRRIVIDGLYTWTEYRTLKSEYPGELIVIAIVAPKRLRHRRLTTRPIRPLTVAEASKRDWAEIEYLEKGGPIAIADHFIINNSDIDELHGHIDTILEEEKFFD